MTISYIAESAGASVPTVSKVVNGRSGAAADTRARVRRRRAADRGHLSGRQPLHDQYDELGRVTSWTDFDGSTGSREFDTDGRVLAEIDASGEVVRFDRPADHGRGTAIQIGPAVVVRNAVQQVTSITTGDGDTHYAYDRLGRIVKIETGQGVTEVGWTVEGELAWRENPDGSVEETDFDGRTQRYAYDTAGQLVERTDAAGEVTHFAYDLLGRVVERRTGTTVTRLTYDAADRIVSATDGDSEIRLERDAIGRVVAETVNGRTVSRQFGALTALSRPSGAVTQWSYDESGRPAVLVAGGQRLRFAYDGGREVGRRWDAGLTSGGALDDLDIDLRADLGADRHARSWRCVRARLPAGRSAPDRRRPGRPPAHPGRGLLCHLS